jgi:hypothetical protein
MDWLVVVIHQSHNMAMQYANQHVTHELMGESVIVIVIVDAPGNRKYRQRHSQHQRAIGRQLDNEELGYRAHEHLIMT